MVQKILLAAAFFFLSPTFAFGVVVVHSTNSPAGWLATGAAPGAGWESDLGFDASSWVPAFDVNSTFTSSFNGQPWNFIWWNGTQSPPPEGWFRYTFNLTDTLINPVFHGFFDDDGELYFNGTLIFDDKSGVANNALTNFDISSLLVQGANLIAFHVIDYGGNRFGGVRLDADEIISNVPEASAAILWGALTISASGLVCWRRMAEGRAAHAGLAER